jgi:hypothetical protein
MRITRYRLVERMSTARDPLGDLLASIDFLAASDYTIDLLRSRHRAPASEAKTRARRIGPHVRIAAAFLDQALSGRDDVSFLPAYYAILNLAKVCILFSPFHAELTRHRRWHGASYSVGEKDSHSLLTEKIQLHTGGALALFYQALAGQKVNRQQAVRMGDVYGHLQDVSHEFVAASRQRLAVGAFLFDVVQARRGLRVIATPQAGSHIAVPKSARTCPILIGFRKRPDKILRFESRVASASTDSAAVVRSQLRPWLIYHTYESDAAHQATFTPITGGSLPMPEEFPIALAFFHLGSVVRYKPEFLARLRDSRYWPVLRLMRHHCLEKFLLLFWCFVQRREYVITRV